MNMKINNVETKVKRVGGSNYVLLPQFVTTALGISPGDKLTLSTNKQDNIILKKSE